MREGRKRGGERGVQAPLPVNAGCAAAAQPAFTGRGALHTALAAAFAPLAHDSRSLVDFSPRGALFPI